MIHEVKILGWIIEKRTKDPDAEECDWTEVTDQDFHYENLPLVEFFSTYELANLAIGKIYLSNPDNITKEFRVKNKYFAMVGRFHDVI